MFPQGVITGAVCAISLTMWISIGSYIEGIPKLKLPYPNGTCSYDGNSTVSAMTTVASVTTMAINITAADGAG